MYAYGARPFSSFVPQYPFGVQTQGLGLGGHYMTPGTLPSYLPQDLGANYFGYGMTAPVLGHSPIQGATTELATLLARVEAIRTECIAMNHQLRSEIVALHTPVAQPQQQWGRTMTSPVQGEVCPIRFRETEAHLYADLYLPYLTAGDIEVEVSGNRIIFQTRVPVAPISRWLPITAQVPRGFECFELPDGRIECSWLTPVPFIAKEVSAVIRDGYLTITAPKSEISNTRQVVKITKETGRRAANEMNS